MAADGQMEGRIGYHIAVEPHTLVMVLRSRGLNKPGAEHGYDSITARERAPPRNDVGTVSCQIDCRLAGVCVYMLVIGEGPQRSQLLRSRAKRIEYMRIAPGPDANEGYSRPGIEMATYAILPRIVGLA